MDQGPPQSWQILALWYWFQFSLGLWRAASITVLSFSTPRNQLREKKELREFLAFAVNLTPVICSNWHDFPNWAPCHFADWFAASIKTQQMSLGFFFLLSFSLVRSPPYFLSLFFFLSVLGLCRTQGFSRCRDQGYSLVAVHGLLTLVASLVAERGLNRAGSIAVEHGLRCPVACGIVLDRGWKHVPCIGRQIPNHWTTREVLHILFCPLQYRRTLVCWDGRMDGRKTTWCFKCWKLHGFTSLHGHLWNSSVVLFQPWLDFRVPWKSSLRHWCRVPPLTINSAWRLPLPPGLMACAEVSTGVANSCSAPRGLSF